MRAREFRIFPLYQMPCLKLLYTSIITESHSFVQTINTQYAKLRDNWRVQPAVPESHVNSSQAVYRGLEDGKVWEIVMSPVGLQMFHST